MYLYSIDEYKMRKLMNMNHNLTKVRARAFIYEKSFFTKHEIKISRIGGFVVKTEK